MRSAKAPVTGIPAALVVAVEAYQSENACTQDAALTALYRKLKRSSKDALKVALSRARIRLAAKGNR